MRIINEASIKTREIITKYKPQIEKYFYLKYKIKNMFRLSEKLLEIETLDLNAIVAILGERPFEPKKNFKSYLETKSTQEFL